MCPFMTQDLPLQYHNHILCPWNRNQPLAKPLLSSPSSVNRLLLPSPCPSFTSLAAKPGSSPKPLLLFSNDPCFLSHILAGRWAKCLSCFSLLCQPFFPLPDSTPSEGRNRASLSAFSLLPSPKALRLLSLILHIGVPGSLSLNPTLSVIILGDFIVLELSPSTP